MIISVLGLTVSGLYHNAAMAVTYYDCNIIIASLWSFVGETTLEDLVRRLKPRHAMAALSRIHAHFFGMCRRGHLHFKRNLGSIMSQCSSAYRRFV